VQGSGMSRKSYYYVIIESLCRWKISGAVQGESLPESFLHRALTCLRLESH
jgi:hypothetical protein